jgi:hypothetical protein
MVGVIEYKLKQIREENEKRVLEYFETALNCGRCSVNYYYSPHVDAYKRLVKKGIIKEAVYRGIKVGTEYKNHLFRMTRGSGDCEEILVMEDKLTGE